MIDKIAYFDFCETLVNFQTADAFVDYVRLTTRKKRMLILERLRDFFFKYKILLVLCKITRYKYPIYKVSKLFQVRGFHKSELEELAKGYYKEKIKPNIIYQTLDILKQKQTSGYKIVIVSGGYDIYLKFFVEEYGIDELYSTKIKFTDKICAGIIDGVDCMYDNKVKIIESKYNKDLIFSEAYSDSESDLPLLKWVNDGYVISRNYHQSWADSNNLKEIIWK